MTFDYDLVIIGGSVAGVYAAKIASQLKARVALVQPQSPNAIEDEIWRFQRQPFPISPELSFYDLPIAEPYSPAILASLGIDVIFGQGQFCPKPKLAFEVNDRLLRSRSYLLAPGSTPAIPNNIEGLTSAIAQQMNQQVFQQFRQSSKPQTPHRLIAIGGSPQGIEIAQKFAQRGSLVTVIIENSRIFAKEDSEAAFLIQAQLEAAGIRVMTNTAVSQIKRINHQIWVQAGNEALEADQVYIATEKRPKIEGLNLERVGVETVNHDSYDKYLKLNHKLQTTRSNIYGCGNLSAVAYFTNVAMYEAKIAIKNALFLPIFKVDYEKIPWAIFTHPQLARVGLTETEATKRYGKDILVFRQYFKNIAAAQLQGETTGFCKLITHRNGDLLGVHMVGPGVSELIHSFALAMENGLKVSAIGSMPHIFPSLSEINHQTAQLWQHHYRIRPWQKVLETFFNWRRG